MRRVGEQFLSLAVGLWIAVDSVNGVAGCLWSWLRFPARGFTASGIEAMKTAWP